ncbi:hypothetical protein JTB14_018647 [Gonioctena quinquepunctata]|nr:hypothetical protein JTB14_018647 [Gonioctena quinquepunctata]
MVSMGILAIFTVLSSICFADAYALNDRRFPEDFMFGAATSAHQIEGAWNEDGKTPNIWDNLTHTRPDFTADGKNADIACDSYHKYKDDVAILKEVGVNHYRFSLSWTRILPSGFGGEVNPAGIAYYKNLINELKANGIEPFVTIFHWDTPLSLQEQGGFLNESMIDWYGNYARICFEAFGDDVKFWLTFNEPKQTCTGGYGYGYFPPLVKSEGQLEYVCVHNLVRAHARAWHIYDEEFRGKQGGVIGITLDSAGYVPASDSEEDKVATETKYYFDFGVYAGPIYHGDYPEIMKTRVAMRSKAEGFSKSRLPEFTEEEKAYLKGTHDFFGLNIYTGYLVKAMAEPAIGVPSIWGDQGVNSYQPSDWEASIAEYFTIVPWTIRSILRFIKEKYEDPKIVITENGLPDSGGLQDEKRILYISEYLSNIRDAMIEDDVKVFGYTVWSIMDNFEWSQGYSQKYGIYDVDYTSLNRTRTPKLSAKYYSQVCHTKCLVDNCQMTLERFGSTKMAPNTSNIPTGVLHEYDDEVCANVIPPEVSEPSKRKLVLVWRNIILFVYLHAVALYGLYLMFSSAKLVTSIYGIILYQLGGLGITAGAHRLWAHRSYKAKWQLKVMLAVFNTLAFENSVIEWARDHRVHHKFSETDADPHNAKRGFFFSHVGWLLCRKHPQVKSRGKGIDMSDLEQDPVLRFQHDNYVILMALTCFILPTMAPMYLWNETFVNAFCVNIFRYVLTLNATWLVNSAAHLYGHKPYDRYINPAENLTVSILALGEGWHNYHHTFPWDYKTSELGKYSVNFSAAFIDFFAKVGWAYDLKTVSEEMIKKRVLRTGDGTHEIWGWGDKDQPKEDYEDVIITHKKD